MTVATTGAMVCRQLEPGAFAGLTFLQSRAATTPTRHQQQATQVHIIATDAEMPAGVGVAAPFYDLAGVMVMEHEPDPLFTVQARFYQNSDKAADIVPAKIYSLDQFLDVPKQVCENLG